MNFDDTQLKDIGVEKPGHRKRMLVELKTLRLKYSIIETKRKISQGPETPSNDDIISSSVPADDPEGPPPPVPPKSKPPKFSPPVPPPRNDSPEAEKPAKPEIPVRSDLGEQNDLEPPMPEVSVHQPELPAIPHLQPELPVIPVHQPDLPAIPAQEPEMPVIPAQEPEKPVVPVQEPERPVIPVQEPERPVIPVQEPERPVIPVQEPKIPVIPNREPVSVTAINSEEELFNMNFTLKQDNIGVDSSKKAAHTGSLDEAPSNEGVVSRPAPISRKPLGSRSMTETKIKRMAPPPPVKSPSFKESSNNPRPVVPIRRKSFKKEPTEMSAHQSSNISTQLFSDSQINSFAGNHESIIRDSTSKQPASSPGKINQSLLKEIGQALSPTRPAPRPPAIAPATTLNVEPIAGMSFDVSMIQSILTNYKKERKNPRGALGTCTYEQVSPIFLG